MYMPEVSASHCERFRTGYITLPSMPSGVTQHDGTHSILYDREAAASARPSTAASVQGGAGGGDSQLAISCRGSWIIGGGKSGRSLYSPHTLIVAS